MTEYKYNPDSGKVEPVDTQGWYAYEVQGIGIPNFDFLDYSPGEAEELVQAGRAQWALVAGGVLTIRPMDWEPEIHESKLERRSDGFLWIVDRIISGLVPEGAE